VMTCLATIAATMVVIMGQLYRAESRTPLVEPDAWLVILIGVGAMALLYYFGQEGHPPQKAAHSNRASPLAIAYAAEYNGQHASPLLGDSTHVANPPY
jgi:multisubunit Na+/H+ antiporter MnhB subunit